MTDLSENQGTTRSGIPVLLVGVGVIVATSIGFILSIAADSAPVAVGSTLLFVVAMVMLAGLYMLQPNMAAVLTLFGDYRGTDRTAGLCWANPLYRNDRRATFASNLMTVITSDSPTAPVVNVGTLSR